MKKIFFALLVLLAANAKAQLNNSWIDYNKTYYKFQVYADGLYRIPQTALPAALQTVNADHFQLWRNGQQVRIFTSVSNAVLGTSDFIEFWGQMNDGLPDKALYRNPDFQLNDKYSLESDTAVYFLTVNTTSPNLRFTALTNTAPSAATPDAYYMNTVENNLKTRMNRGLANQVGEYVYSSSYDQGEGWTSNDIITGSNFSFQFPGINLYTGGPANGVTVKVNAAGNAPYNRNLVVKINDLEVFNEAMPNFDYKRVNVTNLPTSSLVNPNNTIIFSVNGNVNASPNDRIVLATASVTYPAIFNFNNRKVWPFELAPSATGNYLNIGNFSTGSVQPVLYDLTTGSRYLGEIASTAGRVKFVLPASAVARKFILVSAETANVNLINNLSAPKTFTNFSTAALQGDYIIISHPALFNDGNGHNYVDDYRQYRSSANGGSFNAKVYNIQELADQFAFGITGHPASIQGFLKYADQQFAVKPKYVLLVGRGVNYVDAWTNRANALLAPQNLVPTFGWPASDILLASNIATTYPITPLGRIAAITPAEVNNYLQKVMQYEQAQKTSSPYIADKAWMKDFMHVIGGKDSSENASFSFYMNGYKRIAEDSLYGATVETFSKTSSAPVQQANSERIVQLMNNGLGLIGYFGHSSANTFEFNLSDPAVFSNTGKYPFFNVSGCSAGNFYIFDPLRATGNLSISEKYVLSNQRGSIGFLADTHFGIPPFLNFYNENFYTLFSRTMYGGTVGNQLKEVLRLMGGQSTTLDFYNRIHLEEIALHGDPAIKINTFTKPDYVIEEPLVRVNPNIISVADETFNVKVSMENIGKATGDSIWVYVKRKLPNDSIKTLFDQKIAGIRNTDSISLEVPINPNTDKGLNQLIVELDYKGEVDELYETNNKIIKEFYIFEDELRPSSPTNFSIVNQQNITFTANSANALSGNRQYVMEIDTTELFNSAFKKSYNAAGTGGVVQFTPTNLTFTDGTVYYWRVAMVPLPNNDYIWNGFSFVYLQNSSEGVNQSHYYQFQESNYNSDIAIDATDRELKFAVTNTELNVSTGNYPPHDFPSVHIDMGVYPISNWGNAFGTLQFVLLDGITATVVKNNPVGSQGSYGSNAPGLRPNQFEFPFATRAQRNVVNDFIRNNIASSNTVMLYNLLNNGGVYSYVQDWQNDAALNGNGLSLYNTLRGYGFTELDSFKSNRPFFFKFSKDNSSSVYQKVGLISTELITLSFPLAITSVNGVVTSPVFGPSNEWKEFHWRGYSLEQNTKDSVRFKVIGINNAGVEQTLFSIDSTTKDLDISSIDAAQYPYVKLRMENYDSAKGTPYQLRYWRLNYEPVAEGAIAPNILYSSRDTVEQGEDLNITVAFKNISQKAFDSLLKVKVIIKDRNNNDHIAYIPPRKALAPGDTLIISYTFNTANYPGANTLTIDVNPDNHQREQYHYNNILNKNFFVREDNFNPLLDVTFDGVHILNNDIVSSKPNILVKLKDESRFLALADTSLLKVQVRFPDQTLRDYHFGDSMIFIPANIASGENTASIEFRPYFPEDGEYELIVSGRDVNGNKAGDLDYHISFNVINKPMISNLLNYPNPFTTSTAFVFTVTGSQPPQNMRIQILTITGKVVREITMDELGPVHVGRNITEFKWDGTDMYGQKLANGVYLYRVLTNLNGKSLEKYRADGDNTDKFFNKGYGKMYLMR